MTMMERQLQKEDRARHEYAVAARKFVDAEYEFDKAIYTLAAVLDSAK